MLISKKHCYALKKKCLLFIFLSLKFCMTRQLKTFHVSTFETWSGFAQFIYKIMLFLEATRYHLTLIEIGLVLVNALHILSFCTSDSHLYLMFLNLKIRSFFLSPNFCSIFDSFYMYDITSTSWFHVMWKTTSQRAVWLVRISEYVMRYFH